MIWRTRPLTVVAVIAALLATFLTAAPRRAAADPALPRDCGGAHLADPEPGLDQTTPVPRPHIDGQYTPILLVHGWTGDPGMWSKPPALSTLKITSPSNHSLLGNLQGLRGAAVYTLDYQDVAQKWFLDPGAGAARFIAAEGCLSKLAVFKDHRLVIVAHSMGGLIARWSLTDAAPGAADRRRRVGLLVTLGTPYEGSLAAEIGSLLVDSAVTVGAAVDKRIATLVQIFHLLITQCHGVRLPGCDQLNYLVDWFAAVHAFSPNSPQMQALSGYPADTRVETLGTRTLLQNVGGLFFIPGIEVDLGDVIVPTTSATAGNHPQKLAECHLTADALRAEWDTVLVKMGQLANVDARTHFLLGLLGTCFHTNEAQLIQLTNEALGAVAEELKRDESSYVPLAGVVVQLDQQLVPIPPMGPGYLTTGNYLQVSGIAGLDAVNAALRNAITQDQQQLKNRFAQYGTPDPANGPGDYNTDVAHGVISTSSGVVSMLLPTNSAFPGSRHGNGWVSGTFTVPAATAVTVRGLFSDPAAGLAAVAAAAKEHFLATDSCVRTSLTDPTFGDVPAAGLAPTPDNYKYFALTPAGLTVGFDQGQIAANSCDRQRVTIDWQRLRPLLNPAGAKLAAELR